MTFTFDPVEEGTATVRVREPPVPLRAALVRL